MSNDPSDMEAKQSLAPRSEEAIKPRPDTSPAPASTAAPVERYYARCLEQAWGDFRMKLKEERTLGGIATISALVLTIVLFLCGVVPVVSLLPLIVFVAVLLGYIAFVLFRAPKKLTQTSPNYITSAKFSSSC